jgi:hypothetical protein
MGGMTALLGDCDTGWHIRTGEWIFANHGVPFHDMFSFSKPGAPWLAFDWLSAVVFAWLNGHGGLRTVVLFSVVLLSVTFTLLFRLIRLQSNAILAIAITVLAAVASSIHWMARPHLFTLLFVVLFYGALLKVAGGHTKVAGIPYLVLLPAGMILWTNLHGGFFAGILMVAVFGVGEVSRLVFTGNAEEGPAGWRKARWYFLCAAACLGASLINPYTYRLHLHLVEFLRAPVNANYILEYLSPNFHNSTIAVFEVVLVLAAVAAYWCFSQGHFTEPLLLAMWAHAALLAERNIPIFAIVAAVPVARSMGEWLERLPSSDAAEWLRGLAGRFNRLAASTSETEAVGRWHLICAAAVLLVAAVIWAPNPPKTFRAEFDPSRYPAGALETLRRDPSARIFTDDEWGDYLIWSLYPSHKVFVDGRNDFYGQDFEARFIDVLNVKYDWEKTLGGFGVDTILLPINAPLAGALKQSIRWSVVFDDGVALVFRSAGKHVDSVGSVVNGRAAAAGRSARLQPAPHRPGVG